MPIIQGKVAIAHRFIETLCGMSRYHSRQFGPDSRVFWVQCSGLLQQAFGCGQVSPILCILGL